MTFIQEAKMILQLNPTIPMSTPKGSGYAIAVIDYSQEHNLYWVIAIDDSGEIWTYPNTEVRMTEPRKPKMKVPCIGKRALKTGEA